MTGDGDRQRVLRPGQRTVLEEFAAARLLTLDAGTVEISHEALLTAWPLLSDTWLADTRADRIIRTRLHAATEEWTRSSRECAAVTATAASPTTKASKIAMVPCRCRARRWSARWLASRKSFSTWLSGAWRGSVPIQAAAVAAASRRLPPYR